MITYQTPLFLSEIEALLQENQVKNVIDATFAEGGHGLNLARDLQLKVLGIEYDPEMYVQALSRIKEANLGDQVQLVNENFINLESIVKEKLFSPEAIIFDLGLSMRQLAKDNRGLSFKSDQANLDLRLNPQRQVVTGASYLNETKPKQLVEELTKLVESKQANNLVQKICFFRNQKAILTVSDLKSVLSTLNLSSHQEEERLLRLTLQALRMIVNEELPVLKQALLSVANILKKNGLILVISFHSLEDRVVKLFFRCRPDFRELTKKPIINKKSHFARSAKLRVYQKI